MHLLPGFEGDSSNLYGSILCGYSSSVSSSILLKSALSL